MTNLTTIAQPATSSLIINWTALLSVLTISLAAMGTLIKIFGTDHKTKEEDIRESKIIKEIQDQNKEDNKKIETANDNFTEKIEDLKETANSLKLEVERLKMESQNNIKSIEDVKKDYNKMFIQLDELLKQLLEWTN
jgi:septal ring factor EnvC (AmiA/AmiB activator)